MLKNLQVNNINNVVKATLIKLPVSLHKTIKKSAINNETTMSNLICEILSDHFKYAEYES